MDASITRSLTWGLALCLPVIILMTKDPEFRIIAMSIIYPGLIASLANSNNLKVNPTVPIIAGMVTFLLSLLLIKSSKNFANGVRNPNEKKVMGITSYSTIIGMFMLIFVLLSSQLNSQYF